MDFREKTDQQIDNLIANYEKTPGARALPLYGQLLEERARRTQAKHLLNFDRSLEHLTQTAIRQVCTTYAELAKASGVKWSQARHQMNGPSGHLDRLLDLCHVRGLPLLTAICVNQDSVSEGELGKDALAGFAKGARRLGFLVTDELAFHRKCRDECWSWGLEQTERAAR